MSKKNTALDAGDTIATLSITSTGGAIGNLNELKGHWTLLYFYPKDNTPGCTTQAIDLKDQWDFFVKNKVNVFGISKDSITSHDKFKEKYDLPFELISDDELALCELFGVYQEKSMYGKKYMGVVRSSFLIGPDLKINQCWRKISPEQHIEKIIKYINSVI